MLNNWPFFYAMMDMLDMVLTKTDQRVIQFYEECLADNNLKNIGKKLRKQLLSLIHLNKKLIPTKENASSVTIASTDHLSEDMKRDHLKKNWGKT